MTHYCLLPEYGPLHITDYNKFMIQSKKHFETVWDKRRDQNTKLEDFDILRFIAKGSHGKVFIAKNKNSKKFYALKAMEKSEILKYRSIENIKSEIYILQRMNFPFVSHLKYYFMDNSFVYCIEPLFIGGDLYEHIRNIRKFEEHQTKFIVAQVVQGLEYLHNLNIIHRDLKPENVIFDHTGYIKLIDFGCSKIVESRTYTFCGTPVYLAPEISTFKGYGKAVDWWALGVLMYEMTSGYLPFQYKNVFSNQMKYNYKFPNNFSIDLKDLIKHLLQVDLTRRYGNLKNGIKDIKNHTWFRTILWSSLFNRSLTPPYFPKKTVLTNLDKSEPINLQVASVNEFEEEFKGF